MNKQQEVRTFGLGQSSTSPDSFDSPVLLLFHGPVGSDVNGRDLHG